jgi:hypothetical protein
LCTEIAIHFRKGRLVFFTLLCLFIVVFFAGIGAAALEDLPDRPLVLPIVVFVAIIEALFLAMFVWVLGRLLSRAPALVIDDRGVTDHSNVFGVGFAPWTNIMDARPYEFRRNRGVVVILKDPKAVLRGQPFAKALGIRINGLMSVSPMWISTTALPITADEVAAMIRERARAQPTGGPTTGR